MYVVFMVAGMSSRYGGKLKQFAKVGLNNETLIEFSVKQALTAPFTKIIFITNKYTESKFVSLFGNNYCGIPVEYAQQEFNKDIRDRPWGTTGAICSIHSNINEPFILVNSDDLYGEETFQNGYNFLKETGNNIIGYCILEKTMPKDNSICVNRGIIDIDIDNKTVTGLKELFKISVNNNPELIYEKANVNFIGIMPNTLDHLQTHFVEFQEKHKGDRKIECLIPESLNSIIKDNLVTMNCFEIKNSVYGITYPGDEIIIKSFISS